MERCFATVVHSYHSFMHALQAGIIVDPLTVKTAMANAKLNNGDSKFTVMLRNGRNNRLTLLPGMLCRQAQMWILWQ